MRTIDPTNRDWFMANKCMNFSYMTSYATRKRVVFIAGNRFYYQDTLGG